MNPESPHELLELLESLLELSTNHYGNKHALSSFIGILSIRKSPGSVVLADYCLLIVQLFFQMCIAG